MLHGCRALLFLLVATSIFPATGSTQVLRAERLTTDEFGAIDRERTVVIVPGGVLEEHGPFLPAGSDMYQADWLAEALARRLARGEGRTVLMLPMVPLGHSGANDIARRWIHPGTIGAAALEQTLDAITAVAVSAVEGTPWSRDRFYTEANMDPADVQISRESTVRESELRMRQQAWLRRNGLDR